MHNCQPRYILCLCYYLCISLRIHSHHVFSSWWPVNEKEMKSSFSFWFVCWSSSPHKAKQKYYFTFSCLMLIWPCPTESGKTLLSSSLKTTTVWNICVSQTGGSSNFRYSWICGRDLHNTDEILHKSSCVVFSNGPLVSDCFTPTMATLATALISSHTPSIDYQTTPPHLCHSWLHHNQSQFPFVICTHKNAILSVSSHDCGVTNSVIHWWTIKMDSLMSVLMAVGYQLCHTLMDN